VSAETVAVEVGGVSYDGPGGLQVQIVIHDLSALRAEQAAVREQLQFIDQLVDAIPAALSVRDERGRYLRINSAYARLHRCDPAAVRNRSVFDVLGQETAALVARQDAAAMRSSEAVIYDTRLGTEQLQACQLLSRALAMQRADGSVLGVITVDTDVTELWLKDRALVHANAELEALSHRLIRSQEDERRRIARDLHDHVGQILTRLKMSLQVLAARPSIDEAALRPALTLTEDALDHARSLTSSLHPHSLEDLGLEAAVRRQLDNYVTGAIGKVELRVDLQPPRSSAERELVAFRVVQEACTNAIKHAEARLLTLALEAHDNLLWITVRDDGEGFDPGSTVFDRQQRASLGIASMRERVAEIGGEFAIESTPGGGTSVRALLPW
jgi:two-component system, NarL family, sensor histidine kinase UhpB